MQSIKLNRLTPVQFSHKDRWGHGRWLYQCECGKKKVICKHNVDSGQTRSCGCLRRNPPKERRTDSKLTPVKFMYVRESAVYWLYRCDCGTEKVLWKGNVDYGNTKSCGCLRKQQSLARLPIRKTHGEGSGEHITKEYRCWSNIKDRCYNPKSREFKSYGGRGITMYEPWVNSYETFRDWLVSTIGRCPEGKSLDRLNNDGNYEPNNLRWATPVQQANNRRGGLTLTQQEKELILLLRQDIPAVGLKRATNG